MTTNGTEYLVRCWAFSKAGQRCEQLAGHDGNHAIVTEWTDEESFVPGATTQIVPNRVYDGMASFPEGALDETLAKPAPPVVDTCVACGHKHRGGNCKCGCYEFIG